MKKIPLTRGQVALVDDDDYEWLNQWNWYASWRPKRKCFVAVRGVWLPEGKLISIFMHREIMGLEYGDKRQVDHKEHNTLDNRKEFLRVCTRSQNQMNMRKSPANTSGFKGVHYNKRAKKFTAKICFNYNRINLGYFSTALEASHAYDKKAQELFGEYAYLNHSNKSK